VTSLLAAPTYHLSTRDELLDMGARGLPEVVACRDDLPCRVATSLMQLQALFYVVVYEIEGSLSLYRRRSQALTASMLYCGKVASRRGWDRGPFGEPSCALCHVGFRGGQDIYACIDWMV